MYLTIPLFIGTTELILIIAIALLLFGGKKLPELMKGLGQGVQSFKNGLNESLIEDDTRASKKATETSDSNDCK